MDPSAVKAALADVVNANVVIEGLPLAAFGHLPDSIDPPVWASGEVEILPDQLAEGDYEELRVTGHLYTSTGDDLVGQKRLDQLLARTGPASVRTALLSDLTLGGLVHMLWIERIAGYGKYRIASLEQPEVRYYGARIFVRVQGP